MSSNRLSGEALEAYIQKVELDVEELESRVETNRNNLYNPDYGLAEQYSSIERKLSRVDWSLNLFSRAVAMLSQSENGISPVNTYSAQGRACMAWLLAVEPFGDEGPGVWWADGTYSLGELVEYDGSAADCGFKPVE